MPHDKFSISRRKLLAGLGGVGLASAGAGLGTSAYLNDTESFDGNSLTAGSLDLKMDWQQAYYGPSETWEPVNAYPDTNNDGIQDPIRTREQIALAEYDTTVLSELTDEQRNAVEEQFRAQFADLPDDVEMPVIDLDDVKPGDMGEVTISMHLFDNPGYIWMGGGISENADDGYTEPEEAVDETPESGDLADAIRAKVWYDDDCDNRHDTGQPPCIQFVVDDSDSMSTGDPPKNEEISRGIRDYLDALEDFDGTDDDDLSPSAVGVTLFPNGTIQTPTSDKSDAVDAVSALTDDDTAGTIDLVGGIEDGAEALETCPEGSQRVMVVISNGINVDNTAAYTAAQDAVAAGQVDRFVTMAVSPNDPDAVATFQDIADLTADGVYLEATDTTEIYDLINGTGGTTVRTSIGIGEGIGNEQVFAEGTLREVLGDAGLGGADGVLLDADRETEAVECYSNSSTRCVAFKWWLPTDVGNEVQSDRVTFALDFYAEQCRHNAEPEARAPFGDD